MILRIAVIGLAAALFAPANAAPAPKAPPRRPPLPPLMLPLPDGSYEALRGYTGPKTRSDPANCPREIRFRVSVEGDRIGFEEPGQSQAGPFARRWTGSIDQSNGLISVVGADAVPPTRTSMAIGGLYDDASIQSEYCGPGFFRIIPAPVRAR